MASYGAEQITTWYISSALEHSDIPNDITVL